MSPQSDTKVILISGTSGSGKSVALRALEDARFFCVDNLPPEMLTDFVHLAIRRGDHRTAIAIDARNADALPLLLPAIEHLSEQGIRVHALFLDASTETLVRRFSESRRPHPMGLQTANGDGSVLPLTAAIEWERQVLSALRDHSTVVDTSVLRPSMLKQRVFDLVMAASSGMTLVLESFAFKQGVPLDADFVFDVRVLPNPHYVDALRPQTGQDAPVQDYLDAQHEVQEMLQHIRSFLERWIPNFEHDQRSYLTVAIGCTGGQHRSVYLIERLAQAFQGRGNLLVRHRELIKAQAPAR